MTALGVTGNPGDWQHAGDTIGSVAARLADELAQADARGGSGLREAWYGPVAEAHAGLWHRRHGHYHDLLYQAGRAAHALADFAGRLWDLQVRAANLETLGLYHGLHLNGDGTRFTLPSGWESLEHEALALLHARLAESVRDVEAMWRDIEHAVGDLVTILMSVIDALADFQAIEVAVAGTGISWGFGGLKGLAHDFVRDPLSEGADALEHVAGALEHRAEHNLRVAQILEKEWSASLDGDVRRAGRSLVRDARTDAAAADDFGRYAKIGGDAMTVAAVGITAAGTYLDARKHGWTTALEDNAGGWASIAAGVGASAGIDAVLGAGAVAGVAVASPVLVTVGAVVVAGVVAAGVGALVQGEVDHHRAAVGHALHDIGGGFKDIGHGISDLL